MKRTMMPGLLAGRFALDTLLGEGAMGAVYRGRDQATGAAVAIKRLKQQVVERDPEMVARFAREGEALRVLNHPNIVKMLAAIEDGGEHYLVMEYIGGGTLRDLLDRQPELPLDQALSIVLELADALTRAHHLGVIHRDLKPSNVMLAQDGSVRLSDFGVAHFVDRATFTRSGAIVGTWGYLSPEAYTGLALDERADLWSLGVMGFEMLAGCLPFDANTPAALVHAVLTQPIPDLTALRPDLPDRLVDLIYRMLTRSRDERIPSARLVGAEVEKVLREQGIRASRVAEWQPASGEPPPSKFATPTPGSSEARTNLPVQASPFIGRQDELADIGQHLADPGCPLLTLIGPGGMGKTRLGIEIAARHRHAYEHGAYFVPLASLTSAEQIISAIAEAVSLPCCEGEPREQLLNYLREKQILLVLDNFEHLMPEVKVISEIISAAPEVKVIVTSRARLNLAAETLYEVGGMAYPEHEAQPVFEEFEAIQLFDYYARRVNPDYTMSEDDKPAIVQICKLVDGMPLAIELAAVWVYMLSPQEIAQEVEQNRDFLASEMSDLPQRQRSLRAVFDHSWNLLSEAEQAALMKLSVFRGGCSRKAAQAITGVGLPALTGLVNKSLVKRDVSSGQFRIHELLRQFAEERLAEARLDHAVRDQHSVYYLAEMAQREADLQGAAQIEALDEIEANINNVMAAWSWAAQRGRFDNLYAAAHCMYLFFEMKGFMGEGAAQLKLALDTLRDRHPAAPPALTAKLLSRWGWFLSRMAKNEQSEQAGLESHRLALEAGDRREEGFALQIMAAAAYYLHRPQEAEQRWRAAIAIFEALGREWELALTTHGLALAYDEVGDSAQSRALNERALALRRKIGDGWGASLTLHNLAVSYFEHVGDYATARQYLEESMGLSDRLGGYRRTFQLIELGALALMLGDFEQANRRLLECQELCHHLGARVQEASVLILLAEANWLAGEYDAALSYARQGLQIAEEIDEPGHISWGNAYVALVSMDLGRYGETRAALERALAAAAREKTPWAGDLAYLVLGELERREGHFAAAWSALREGLRRCLMIKSRPRAQLTALAFFVPLLAADGAPGDAVALSTALLRHPLSVAFFRRFTTPVMEGAAASLPPDEFAAAQARGRTLDLDAYIEELLAGGDTHTA